MKTRKRAPSEKQNFHRVKVEQDKKKAQSRDYCRATGRKLGSLSGLL